MPLAANPKIFIRGGAFGGNLSGGGAFGGKPIFFEFFFLRQIMCGACLRRPEEGAAPKYFVFFHYWGGPHPLLSRQVGFFAKITPLFLLF